MRTLTLSLVLVLAACGSSDSSPTGSTPPGGGGGQAGAAQAGGGQAGAGQAGSANAGGNPMGSSFVHDVGAAYCNVAAGCCAAAGKPLDPSGCQAFFDGAAAGVTSASTFDPALAATCLAAIPSLGCSELPPASCGQALVGPGKPGDPCKFDFDCQFPAGAADAGCVHDGSVTSPGTCFVELPVMEGAPCGGPSKPVEHQCVGVPGYYCKVPTGSSTGVCSKVAPIGGSCSIGGGQGCVDGAWCNGTTCVKSGDLGDGCNNLGACAKGLYCTGFSPPGTCAMQLPEGAPCKGNDQCQGDCGPAGTCTKPTVFGPSPFCL